MLSTTRVNTPETIVRLLQDRIAPQAPVAYAIGAQQGQCLLTFDGETLRCVNAAWRLETPWMGAVDIEWTRGDDWMRFQAWGILKTGSRMRLHMPASIMVPEFRAHRRHTAVHTRAELLLGDGRSLMGRVRDLSIAGAGIEVLSFGGNLRAGDKLRLRLSNEVVGRVDVPVVIVKTDPSSGSTFIALTFAQGTREERRQLMNHVWYAADPGRFAQNAMSAR